ncbi:hypothetical protein JCM10207_004997 [Rhodosporidiobolus poonsookiae]
MSGAFSFPPAQRTRAGRPGPQRTKSGGGRASPYERPGATPPTASDGKWQHDLFGEGSNVYQPSLNTGALKSKLHGWTDAPSPSLRPFGAATPASQSLTARPAAQNGGAPAPAPAVANGGATLTARLGIKGSSDAAQQKEREAAQRRQAQREREEAVKARKMLEKERQETVKIAKEEECGFVVQVMGLVSGTSAEDVQTAFGQYGDIRFCFIVDAASSNLIARLTFTKHDDASTACEKLNGAVADGRPLSVKQVARTPMPPALPKLAPATVPTGPKALFAGVPTAPKGRRGGAKQAAPPPPPPIPSHMYADAIEAAEAAAYAAPSDAMDVDSSSSAPAAGPRGRNNRGRGGASAAPPAPAQPPSLAQRLGGGNAPPTGPRKQQQQQAQQPSTLAARLGVSDAPSGPKGKGKRGGKGGGAGGAANGAQGGAAGSLLARLK